MKRQASTAAAILALLIAAVALADKTVTVLSASATITRMRFQPRAGGSVVAEVCGRSSQTDGGLTAETCYDTVLPNGNSTGTAVNNLATGGALTFWKTQEGL